MDTYVVKPPEAQMSRLMTLHRCAVQLARAAPDVLARPSVAKALEQSGFELVDYAWYSVG